MRGVFWLRTLAPVAGLLLAAGTALAEVPVSTSLVVEPANPTSADSIRVIESTEYPSACWGDMATACAGPLADMLVMETQVRYVAGCAQVYDLHTRQVAFAPLPAGTYRVVFRELHEVNPPDPMTSFSLETSFTVDVATPAARRSWGALKLHYR